MLLHHFGSRDELLLSVVDEVERRQMDLMRELTTDGVGFAAMWEHLRRPELRALERLFFECYARGAQGESPFTTMLPGFSLPRHVTSSRIRPGSIDSTAGTV